MGTQRGDGREMESGGYYGLIIDIEGKRESYGSAGCRAITKHNLI